MIRAVVAALALVLAIPQPALAVQFHKYSIARENNQGSGYTGIKTTRPVTFVNISGSSSCWPVYQTQWVNIGGGRWVELGTAHTCSGRYHYWGYTYDGVWYDLGHSPAAADALYTFTIREDDYGYWHWWIDGVERPQEVYFPGRPAATGVETGLESYNQSVTVPYYGTLDMKASRWGNSFVAWAGKDSKTVSPSEMCGHWETAVQWYAGQNGGC